jgi:hypothetical protein
MNRSRETRIARDKEYIARVRKTLDGASAVLLNAKKAADLDELLAQLTEFAQDPYTNRPHLAGNEVNVVQSKSRSAQLAVQKWQDYLMAVETKDTRKASEALRSLADRDTESVIKMPRSEILARQRGLEPKPLQPVATPTPKKATPEDVGKLYDSIKDLDDIAPVLSKVRAATRNSYSSSSDSTLSALDTIEQTYAGIKAGLPVTLHLTSTSSLKPERHDLVFKLEAKMLLLALPRALDVPASDAPKPNETVEDFLTRLASKARETKNWASLARILTVSRDIGRNFATAGITNTRDELATVNYYLDGLRQERARQYILAVSSYQSALTAGAPDDLAAAVGERLETIKKEHATDYETALERKLNPPRDTLRSGFPYSTYPPGYPPGYRSAVPEAGTFLPTRDTSTLRVPAPPEKDSKPAERPVATPKAESPAPEKPAGEKTPAPAKE